MDPELAMMMKQSLEEERARQQALLQAEQNDKPTDVEMNQNQQPGGIAVDDDDEDLYEEMEDSGAEDEDDEKALIRALAISNA